MVGYAFGSPRDKTQNIWDEVRSALPDLRIPEQVEPVYIFREFAVDPRWQRHGFGRVLHDALLGDRPEQLAHLLVRPDNIAARSAYLSWGWRKISEIQPFPDAPVMDAMVSRASLWTAQQAALIIRGMGGMTRSQSRRRAVLAW